MKRDVKEIRKNIAKRKREKTIHGSSTANKSFSPLAFPQDEEKHGYVPFSADSDSGKSMKDTFITSFMMKSILAAVLFFGTALFLRMDAGWVEQPRQWTYQALTEEFPFASVNHWYEENFGSPLALTTNETERVIDQGLALPVNGTVSQSFDGQGIRITANETSEVYAMDKGIVIFAGNDRETNKTVIVQHHDKSKTIYGNLTSINVHQYQFIGNNEVIGEFVPSEANARNVFFGIEKDNQYIDPVQVMQVDERP